MEQTRAFKRMVKERETYTTIAKKLEGMGIQAKANVVYRWITGKKKASMKVKKGIATILRCLVEDIF